MLENAKNLIELARGAVFGWRKLGVLIGMVHYMIPYAVLPLLVSMQSLDTRVMDASRNLGASGSQTFWRIYLPLTTPGLVASTLLAQVDASVGGKNGVNFGGFKNQRAGAEMQSPFNVGHVSGGD